MELPVPSILIAFVNVLHEDYKLNLSVTHKSHELTSLGFAVYLMGVYKYSLIATSQVASLIYDDGIAEKKALTIVDYYKIDVFFVLSFFYKRRNEILKKRL